MIRTPIGLRWYLALGILSIVVLLVAYSALAAAQKRKNPDDTTVPSWTQLKEGVVKSIEPHKRTGERWLVVDTKATGVRLLVGMLLGVGGAVLLGVLMGCFPLVEAIISPPPDHLCQNPRHRGHGRVLRTCRHRFPDVRRDDRVRRAAEPGVDRPPRGARRARRVASTSPIRWARRTPKSSGTSSSATFCPSSSTPCAFRSGRRWSS